MDEREKLLRQIFGEDLVEDKYAPQPPINTYPLFPLHEVWPAVIDRLRTLLTEAGEMKLAATVAGLWVYDRCRCGADHCATVYTQPRPSSGYGPAHRNVVFWNADTIDLDTGKAVRETCGTYPTTEYLTVLDVVEGQIACIEILHDQESRRALVEALPDVTI